MVADRTASADGRSPAHLLRNSAVATLTGAVVAVNERNPVQSNERVLAAQYRGWAKAVSFQYPFTSKMLEEMARGYDREAVWHDTEANVRKRLNY
jgi:hypothetical protein